MATRQTIPYQSGMFFITFTCYRWLPLIDKVNGYDIVYNWFDVLKSKGHYINGYVIMPNHVHALISFINAGQTINTIIGNGKRFMAYEIIERLKENEEHHLLFQLVSLVTALRRKNKKLHDVWELSFDWKYCQGRNFILQKLNYMHNNPCAGKWQLAFNAIEYKHSSAQYYYTGEQGGYPVTDITNMNDVNFNEGNNTQ